MGLRAWVFGGLRERLAALALDVDELRTACARLAVHVDELDKAVNRTHAAKLAAEIEDIRGALQVNYTGVRRELQRLYAKLSHIDREDRGPETPEEARARLRANMPVIGGGKE